MRSLRRRAKVVGETRDAADLRADGLIGAIVVERAIDDVALDLIVGDCAPIEIDVTLVRDAFRFCGDGIVCVAVELKSNAFPHFAKTAAFAVELNLNPHPLKPRVGHPSGVRICVGNA